MSLQVYQNTIFGEIIYRNGVQPGPRKLYVLTEMPSLMIKKELKLFIGIMNYLGKFSPSTVEVCKPLRKLTSSKK